MTFALKSHSYKIQSLKLTLFISISKTEMFSARSVLLIFVLIFVTTLVESYKAVVLLHGIMTGADSMKIIEGRIKEVGSATLILLDSA